MEVKGIMYCGYIDAYIQIFDIEYGINDRVVFNWKYQNGCQETPVRKAIIRYDAGGNPYFISYGKRRKLDEAMRV